MLKSIELSNEHITTRIKESFVKEFVESNNLEKTEGVGMKRIYDVDGVPTLICAYQDGFQARQFSSPAVQVICYSDDVSEWRMFPPIAITTRSTTRRDLSGIAGYNVTFEKEQGVLI
jgi:hypothetical protein